MDSTLDQSSLPIVTVPRIVSVVSKADVSQPCNTVMNTTEMIAVQFMNTDDELLVDVQDEPAPNTLLENVESSRETSDDISDALPNATDLPGEPTCMTEQQNVPVTVSTGMSEEIVQPPKQNQDIEMIDQDSSATGDIENQSPNLNQKRSPSDGILLHKSTKKHASTEMKFRCFTVNWNKISDHLLDRLRALQEFKNTNPNVFTPASIRVTKTEVTALTNAVVEQLRMIDTQIRAETMETVARQILEKFPAMDYTDDDGFGAGQGYVDLKYKMINRNNYLNRFKNAQASCSNNAATLKKKRNARAGTLKEYWEKSSKQCDKSMQSILVRDEPNLLSNEFLLESQAYIRFKLDEKIDTAKMISQLPVLRRRVLLLFHFEKATGVKVGEFQRYFSAKRGKIIQYSLACKPNLHLNESSSDSDVLQFLCSLVGETFSELIIHKEVSRCYSVLIVLQFKLISLYCRLEPVLMISLLAIQDRCW